ncbi:head-tail connector protein [Paraburkholderia sp.]|jgi:uncharacterized phiE125 gp8 family phage protein|uniref:head-tail connector protein n=1 Tax=Paraburkholderia sp. TaxID=1926495 RepID=UPI002F3E2FE4
MEAVVIAAKDAAEPVPLDLAKQHCRIDTDDDDGLLEAVYLPSSRQSVEQYTGLTLLAGEVTVMVCGCEVARNAIHVPVQPVASVSALSAIDSEGTETVLDPVEYGITVTTFIPGTEQLVLSTKALPSATLYRVTYATGFADDTCPPNLKLAILEYVGDAYENREAQQSQYGLNENPRAVRLMDPFRLTFGV